jgi:LacI family transcriptional regulator
MVSAITDPFCTPILRGLENSLYQSNYLSLLADAHNDACRFERYLEILLDRRVEGLIIIANWLVTDIKVLADLTEKRVPTEVAGREVEFELANTVSVEGRRRGVSAGTFTSIGTSRNSISSRTRSAEQQRAALERHSNLCTIGGHRTRPEENCRIARIVDANSSFDAGMRRTAKLLRRGKPFTALLAYDDVTALGALRALKKKGLRVPEECSVIGFDDVAQAGFSIPSLTTVRQPMAEMGAMSAGIVKEAIKTGELKRIIPVVRRKISAELIARESTGPLLSLEPTEIHSPRSTHAFF